MILSAFLATPQSRTKFFGQEFSLGGHLGGTGFLWGGRAPPGPPMATPLGMTEILVIKEYHKTLQKKSN